MVNINKLKGRIVEKGLSVELVAQSMGIDRSTLYRKMKDQSGDSFTISDVQSISRILSLSAQDVTDIFFNEGVA